MKLGTDAPDKWRPLIDRAKELEGWVSDSAYIRDLIREDLKRKGLLGVQNGREEKEAVVVEG